MMKTKLRHIGLLTLGGILLLPAPAFAYLDPGTGNALIYLFISLGGALIYFIRNIFYKICALIKGDKLTDKSEESADIIIFSEGKNYWLTYKGIIEELIRRDIPFKYLSLDIHDPALTIDEPCMHSCWVGKGSAGFARVACSRGKILLTSTPNIGCAGYPLPRPTVDRMALVSHAVSDTSYLKKGAIDHYDLILDVGPWCENRLRRLEELRGLSPKKWKAVGLPYLDELARNIAPKNDRSDGNVILVAPSWGDKSLLNLYGSDFIFDLLRHDFDVILRPHPQSWNHEQEMLEKIIEKASVFPRFKVDREPDSTISMRMADIMISDSSSVRYDFVFLYKKPVITFSVPMGSLSSFEADTLGGPWDEGIASRLGWVISPDDDFDIIDIIHTLKMQDPARLEQLYEELISNHGRSAQAIVDALLEEKDEIDHA